ncbi:MAG: MFS transporter, partial [Pseudomonadota bacterium]
MAQGFKEFKYGTPVVVASALGIGLGMSPLPFYTIGVFALAYEAEFGWPIQTTLSALMIFTFVAFFMSPIVGYIADRVGVRRVVLVSIVTFSLTMMAHALNNGSFALYLLLWSLLSVFGAGTLPITWTRAVNGWFHERRGLALGISLIATGFFGAAAKIFASYMIDVAGWRMAYVAVGALPLLIAFPVAYFFFHPVDDPRVADKVAKLKQEVHVDVRVATSGMTLSRALRDWRFWLLAYAFVPVSFAVGGPIPNLERMMVSKGFGAGDASPAPKPFETIMR